MCVDSLCPNSCLFVPTLLWQRVTENCFKLCLNPPAGSFAWAECVGGVISALHFLSHPLAAWKLGPAKQALLNTASTSETVCGALGFGRNDPACYCRSLSWVRIKLWVGGVREAFQPWRLICGSACSVVSQLVTTLFLLCLHTLPCHSMPNILHVSLWLLSMNIPERWLHPAALLKALYKNSPFPLKTVQTRILKLVGSLKVWISTWKMLSKGLL